MGLTGYSDSTPLALSNDTNSFGIITKSTDCLFSTETTIERPHKFTYARACMSHDRVQPPLVIIFCLLSGRHIARLTQTAWLSRDMYFE